MDINPLFPIASAITARLGWRFHVTEGAGQIVAYPPGVSTPDETI